MSNNGDNHNGNGHASPEKRKPAAACGTSTAAGHGEKLTRKQERAVLALMAEPTITAAAEKIGVSERTLRLWLKRPAFRSAWNAAKDEMMEAGVAALQRWLTEAVGVLHSLAIDKDTKAAARVSAAKAIAELAIKGKEQMDFADRLTRIEQALASTIGGAGRFNR